MNIKRDHVDESPDSIEIISSTPARSGAEDATNNCKIQGTDNL